MQKNKDLRSPMVASVLKMPLQKSGWTDGDGAREAMVSGQLGIGKNGNPVTIAIEDEITGEIIEISNVKNALLMIEETRKSSSGWLSLVIGEESKLKEVISFLSHITLDGLRKMSGK